MTDQNQNPPTPWSRPDSDPTASSWNTDPAAGQPTANQSGYGAPPAPGYGSQPQYGAPQGQPGYGAPQGQPGYGSQPQYGAPQGQPGYGAQPQYGAPQGQPGYDVSQPPSYAATPQFANAAAASMYQGTGAGLPPGMVPASFWHRVGARLIDVVINWIIWGILIAVTGDALVQTTEVAADGSYRFSSNMTPLGMLLGLLMGAIFELVIPATAGGQIGKLVTGLRIARADHPHTIPAGWGGLAGRWLILVAMALPCGIPALLSYLSVLWSKDRNRAWHDQVGKTMVVKRQA